jgi:hypothetical protein
MPNLKALRYPQNYEIKRKFLPPVTRAEAAALCPEWIEIETQGAQTQAGPPAQILTSIPQNAMTVTNWYKQNVYDPSDNKIGEIMDVLVDRDGSTSVILRHHAEGVPLPRREQWTRQGCSWRA